MIQSRHCHRNWMISPFLGLLALLLLVLPAGAMADPQYSVMNAPEGVYWRSEPNWAAAERINGFGVYNGEIIEVHCYQSGSTVEGSSDAMWESASDVNGPGYGSGWINEHFINDNQPINQPSPGVPPCGGSPAPPPPSSQAPPAPAAPPKPTCYGDYCSGKNPIRTNCSIGATMIASVPKSSENPAALELFWSPACKTKWARMIISGWWAPARMGAEQSTGYQQETGIGGHYSKKTEVLSPMIYSPKKCVKAWYVPEPGYKWNEVTTACR